MAATKTKSAANKSNGKGGVSPAKRAVESAAKDAGHAATGARIPLVAAAAATVGVAGGLAWGRRHANRKERVLGVAKEIGSFGTQVGHLASELQAARENAGAGRTRRSPIEVVLEGLTARRLPG